MKLITIRLTENGKMFDVPIPAEVEAGRNFKILQLIFDNGEIISW